MLIKNHEERRDNVTLDAKIKLLKIIEQTTGITKADWIKNEIKDPIKGVLCDFVGFVKDNKIVGWLGELDEFGYIREFCEGRRDLDIKNLQGYLDTIKDSLIH